MPVKNRLAMGFCKTLFKNQASGQRRKRFSLAEIHVLKLENRPADGLSREEFLQILLRKIAHSVGERWVKAHGFCPLLTACQRTFRSVFGPVTMLGFLVRRNASLD
jgi:hypothetical protein